MKDLMKLDLYDLLNIKANAAEAEIKKAYRRKALICHPDKNPDNPKAVEDFKQLSKAVEILTDKVKRADYDKVLRERKAARSKIIYVRLSKVIPASFFTSKDKEDRRKSKEDRRKETHRHDPKKRPPSSSKAQDKNENGPKQNADSKRDSPFRKDEKKSAPTWPPTFSKTQATNESSFKQNMRRDCPQKNRTKRSVPTWPTSTSKTQPKKEGGSRQNINFKWNFSSILKPATFIAPPPSGCFSNNSFTFFPRNQNQTGSSFGIAPIIKPATFVRPSDNKASTGFSWGSSSSILKPATFIPPSKS